MLLRQSSRIVATLSVVLGSPPAPRPAAAGRSDSLKFAISAIAARGRRRSTASPSVSPPRERVPYSFVLMMGGTTCTVARTHPRTRRSSSGRTSRCSTPA